MAVSAPSLLASSLSTANVLTSGAVAVGTLILADTFLMVPVVAGSASAGLAISDSSGNTWSSITTATAATGSAAQTTIFYTKVTSALLSTGTITVTRTPTGSLSMWILASTGQDLSGSPLDNGGTSTTGNSVTAVTTISAGALSSVAVGSLVVQVSAIGTGYGTATPGSGFTTLTTGDSTGGSNPRGGNIQYQVAASAGSITAQHTVTSGKAYAAAAFAVKQAATGPVPAVVAATASVDSATIPNPAPTPAVVSAATTIPGVSLIVHPTLTMIGDSLTFRAQANDAVTSREPNFRARAATAGYSNPTSVYWWGVGGKGMVATDSAGKTTAQNLTDAVAQLGTPLDRVAIGLATNDFGATDGSFDATFNARVDTVTAALNSVGVSKVIWLNTSFKSRTNTNAAYFNPLLAARVAAAASTYSMNITYLDWNAYFHDLTDLGGVFDPTYWNSSDATHLTAAGYAVRDAYIFGQLEGAVTAVTVAAVTSIPTPTFSAAAKPTPAVVAAAATVPAITFNAAARPTPAVVAAATTIPAPGLQVGVALPAVRVLAVTTIPAPTVTTTSGALVTPTVVAGVASIPTPAVSASGNQNIPVTVVSATASIPAPTLAAGSAVAPIVVAAATSIPSPTITAGGGALPTSAVVAALAFIPAVVVQLSRTAAASVVAALASIPAPTVSTGSPGALVTPTRVLALAGVAAPTVTGNPSGVVVLASTVLAQARIPFPALVVTPPTPVQPAPTGNWYSLYDIYREGAAWYAEDKSTPPVACPNDGEPLLTGPRGELYCPFDGWQSS